MNATTHPTPDAVLTRATTVGMPEPVASTIHNLDNTLSIVVRTLADLTDWALWLDAPINERPTDTGAAPAGTLYSACGDIDGCDVEVRHWARRSA